MMVVEKRVSRIAQTITLGTFRDPEVMCRAMYGDHRLRNNYRTISGIACRRDFEMVGTPTKAHIVTLTLEELGFSEYAENMEAVRARAREIGLEICPDETAIQWRCERRWFEKRTIVVSRSLYWAGGGAVLCLEEDGLFPISRMRDPIRAGMGDFAFVCPASLCIGNKDWPDVPEWCITSQIPPVVITPREIRSNWPSEGFAQNLTTHGGTPVFGLLYGLNLHSS